MKSENDLRYMKDSFIRTINYIRLEIDKENLQPEYARDFEYIESMREDLSNIKMLITLLDDILEDKPFIPPLPEDRKPVS